MCGLWTKQRNTRVSALACAPVENKLEQVGKLVGLRNGIGGSQSKVLENTRNRDLSTKDLIERCEIMKSVMENGTCGLVILERNYWKQIDCIAGQNRSSRS